MRSPRRIAGFVAARMRARAQGLRPGVEIGPGTRFGRGVRCVAGQDARVLIGSNVEIGSTTQLVAMDGATVSIGEGTFISGGCTIAAARHISIGQESMLAELVGIRDHDHDPSYPPRSGQTIVGEIRIGARVWIGSKASVVRGGNIGDDAVIGAHALVNRDVPPRSLAVGVPARAVRQVR